ncbi:hypothetical protein ACSSNL_09855 [Thalassobius sp. S69A]|uniref:hypothetical protein n=1 Tax=unclassified Thalassovita TaxID=2619711 RepID=UPI003C7BAC69
MSERLRIVNLGLPKSGTTTLAHALRVSGLRTADYRIRKRQTPDSSLHNAFVGELMYRSYFSTGDPLEALDHFDALSEISTLREGHSLWPQMDWGLIDAIRTHHPQTRFVATWRPPEALSNSIMRWSNLGTERLPAGHIPGLPQGYGDDPAQRVQWICAHYAHLERLFADDPDFLILDVQAGDARAQLSRFLQHEITWWGKANRNRTAPRRKPKETV